jgi:N-acetylglucosaminyl-diphospho-decaprenol L-rhamnosyltransferase
VTVDVVIVSFNSGGSLRGCVEPLVGLDGVRVIVVDNASPEPSLPSVADLPVETVQLDRNRGFGSGCNAGWRRGSAPFVLFLNPDARIDRESLDALIGAFGASVGIVGPRILAEDGSLEFSRRRYPRLQSTFAQALFLHRLFPGAEWVDEVVRDRAAYENAGTADRLSGACLLVRREVLESLDGFDEGFFMYCEDKDLCLRSSLAGWDVRYEPGALVVHAGGASAPRAGLLPVLAASRLRYATKHRSAVSAFAERVGIAIGALTHLLVTRKGRAARIGYARALAVALVRRFNTRPV